MAAKTTKKKTTTKTGTKKPVSKTAAKSAKTEPKKKVAPKKVKKEEKVEPACFGALDEDDPNCTEKCDRMDECTKESERLAEELDLEEEEDEDEEDIEGTGEEDEDFDPESLNLEDDDVRIDVLSDLDRAKLDAIVEHYNIAVPDDAEDSMIILEVDDFFAKGKQDEGEEEEEEEEVKPTPKKKASSKKPAKKAVAAVPWEEPSIAGAAAMDSVCETLEMVIDHNKVALAKYGEIDHITGIRNSLNDVINALGDIEDDGEDSEEDTPAPKKKVTTPKKGAKEKEDKPVKKVAPKKSVAKSKSPEIPDWFTELAEEAEAEVTIKEKRVVAKYNGKNLATLLLKRDGWLMVFNSGNLTKLAGTTALKSWNDYPSIEAGSDKAEKLFVKHIKAVVG